MKPLIQASLVALVLGCSPTQEKASEEKDIREQELMALGMLYFTGMGLWEGDDRPTHFVVRGATADPFVNMAAPPLDPDPFGDPLTDLTDGGLEQKDQPERPETPEQRYARILASSGLIDEALARRFVEKSQDPLPLEPGAFPEGFSVTVLLEPEEDALFDAEAGSMEPGWNRFCERYPKADGILTVSRVVFSEGKSRALMSIWQQKQPVVGDGGFLIFHRVGRLWTCERVWDAPTGNS